jgi:pimeloyl-ACP methyl ester carboxylesterase
MVQTTQDYSQELAACAEAIGITPPVIVLPQDRWLELNGIRFHALDWGNPELPPVVLLHGGGLTAHTWDMASLLLRDRYHLIALDQRGHGDTGWTPDEQLGADNAELMLEDTRAFIESLGNDRIVLCGMSMGGMNAIRFAARHPEKLQALVIVDVGPVVLQQGVLELEQFRRDTETLRRFDDFLERAVRFNPQRKPAHLRYSLLHSLKPVPDGWTWKQDHRPRPQTAERSKEELAAERQERSEAMWRDVEAIPTPTLLMRGEKSPILSAEAAREMVSRMPDCELVEIPAAGHSVQGDNPQAFAQELDRFVAPIVSTG